MKQILKYGNRKLYDKDLSKYTNLAELVKLPLGTFQIVLHTTGEDVTTDTLLSILTSENLGSEIKVQVMKKCIAELEEQKDKN